MRFLCDFLCGEVLFIDENIDEEGCLICPHCKGSKFIVKSISNESTEEWIENERLRAKEDDDSA